MPDKNKPKVEAALFCDDIRVENNGKEIIIGAYSGSILVESFPFNIMLRAYLVLSFGREADGEIPLNFKATYGEREITQINGGLQGQGAGTFAVQMPIPLGQIDSPGVLQVFLQSGQDENWDLVLERSVLQVGDIQTPSP